VVVRFEQEEELRQNLVTLDREMTRTGEEDSLQVAGIDELH